MLLAVALPIAVWLAPAVGELENPARAVRERLEDRHQQFTLVPSREEARLQLRITDFRVSRSTRVVQFGYLDVAGPGVTQQERMYESWQVVGAAALDGEVHPVIGMDGPKDASRMNLEEVAADFVRELEAILRER